MDFPENMTHTSCGPVWSVEMAPKPDAGLFYVRWWAADSANPVEYDFRSRKDALQKMDELHRFAPYAKIEFLEAIEWSTRTRSRALSGKRGLRSW